MPDPNVHAPTWISNNIEIVSSSQHRQLTVTTNLLLLYKNLIQHHWTGMKFNLYLYTPISLLIISPFPMTGCTGIFMSDPNSEHYIPDSSITASSEFLSVYLASEGRLQDDSIGWIPDDTDTQACIQADIGHVVNVYGLQTQLFDADAADTLIKVSIFQNIPNMGDVGDFIKDGNDDEVRIKRKQLTCTLAYIARLASLV